MIVYEKRCRWLGKEHAFVTSLLGGLELGKFQTGFICLPANLRIETFFLLISPCDCLGRL